MHILPYSANRYWFDDDLTFCDQNGPMPINNNRVTLCWLFGTYEYDLDYLWVICSIPTNLPTHLWDQIDPIVGEDKNGDTLYCYRFKKPLEVANHPGYYYIPRFTLYAVSALGKVITVETGHMKSLYVSSPGKKESNRTGGYIATRVLDDTGRSLSLYRHRALCSVFKTYDVPLTTNPVNHINGVPGDDRLDNIEWSTYKKNAEHALYNGFKPNSIRAIKIKDINTGEVLRFSSIAKCSDFLKGLIGPRSLGGHAVAKALTPIGGQWLARYEEDEWPDTHRVVDAWLTKDLMARNVHTGNVIIASGARHLSSLVGVSETVICNHVKGHQVIPSDGWNFRALSTKADWPIHTERHLLCYKEKPRNPRGGCIVNYVDGIEVFYPTLKRAVKELDISYDKLGYAISSGKLVEGKYKVSKFDLKSTIRSASTVT